MWTDGDSGSPVPIEELLDKQKRRTGRSNCRPSPPLPRWIASQKIAPRTEWAQRLNEESRAGRGTGRFRAITVPRYGPRAYRSVTLRPSPGGSSFVGRATEIW